jgi:cytoskeletal protein RodZ
VAGAQEERVELGRYLTAQRERRGRELRELAQATRIPASLLEALEYGDAERLPDRVFLANYLKAYAAELGLPLSELEARFQAAYGRAEEIDPVALERERRRRAMVHAVLAGGLALAGLVLFFFMNRSRFR